MDCLMVFDHSNDLIFTKYNSRFNKHISNLATIQGLISKDQVECTLDSNILIQIFSPIVSSHRIMHFQFGNSYSTIQFSKDMKLCFCEFMGYLFMAITDGVIKNLIDMYVTFARYLCGPDIYQLKNNESTSILFSRLIDKWLVLRKKDQAVYLEAVEQLVVNNDISSTCLRSLKDSISKLSAHTECSRVHALLFVDNKFLSLYSSSQAYQLSPADILFMIILTHCVSENSKDVQSYQVFLSGPEADPRCLPHAAHILKLLQNVFLVYLIEVGDPLISASLFETFYHLHRLRFIQVQREKSSIQLGYQNLGMAVKRLNDALKKSKIKTTEALYKQLTKKWDMLNGKYNEYLKTSSDEAILRAETLAITFLDDLKELHNITAENDSVLLSSAKYVPDVIDKITAVLLDFDEYFKVKCIKNFSLGSIDSLVTRKYLEEFPGLVHFLYVDRNTHRVTTPSLDMEADKSEFIQDKIWFMISFAHSHLQEGHTSVIWKDKIFTYGYFLWFEDTSGGSLKLATMSSCKNPGILSEDFYTYLLLMLFGTRCRSSDLMDLSNMKGLTFTSYRTVKDLTKQRNSISLSFDSDYDNTDTEKKWSIWKKILVWSLSAMAALIFLTFILIWVAIPVAFKLSIGLQRLMVFMPFDSPKNPKFDHPEHYGIEGVRNFYISVIDYHENRSITNLGAWLIMPEEHKKSPATEDISEIIRNTKYDILIYLHGVFANRAKPIFRYEVFRKYFLIIAVDHRGYGDSGKGVALSEVGIIQDNLQIYDWIIHKNFTNNIYYWGHSLGTGLSCHTLRALKEQRNFIPKGLVLESAFTTLAEEIVNNVLGKIFKWLAYFNATVIRPLDNNGFRFLSTSNILQVDCPIMMLHADDDEVIPSFLGAKLADIARTKRNLSKQGNVTFHLFPSDRHYGHDYILMDPQVPNYIREFKEQCESFIITSEPHQ